MAPSSYPVRTARCDRTMFSSAPCHIITQCTCELPLETASLRSRRRKCSSRNLLGIERKRARLVDTHHRQDVYQHDPPIMCVLLGYSVLQVEHRAVPPISTHFLQHRSPLSSLPSITTKRSTKSCQVLKTAAVLTVVCHRFLACLGAV